MFFVYILRSEFNDRYYVGSTNDLSRRVLEHNAGKTKSTKSYRPWKLVYSETFHNLAEARQREKQIKSWKNREYMLKTLGLNR